MAWGSKPHSDIIDAALAALPPDSGLVERLGENAPRLRAFVQMGDWQDTLAMHNEVWRVSGVDYPSSGQLFYTNDYLIFPGSTKLYGHMLPDVRSTYGPFFDRALQALRMESASNAARWMGSLLHYVTDTGSPPHTTALTGDAHTKMENWLDASKLDLQGYKAKALTREAYLARMEGLIEFSKQRADRLKPLIAADDRTQCEPVIMESAGEAAKVAADVIYSLLKLSQMPVPVGRLEAEIMAPQTKGLEELPARLAIENTTISTMSDVAALRPGVYRGHFTLRGIEPGKYRAFLSRPGAKAKMVEFTIGSVGSTRIEWTLEPDDNNRIRNCDFSVRWVTANAPDYWRYDGRRKQWMSDNVAVNAGKKYEIKPEGILVEWMSEHWQAAGPAVDPGTVTAPEKAHFVRILIKGEQDQLKKFRQISIREVE
jgi:hypothetical protein